MTINSLGLEAAPERKFGPMTALRLGKIERRLRILQPGDYDSKKLGASASVVDDDRGGRRLSLTRWEGGFSYWLINVEIHETDPVATREDTAQLVADRARFSRSELPFDASVYSTTSGVENNLHLFLIGKAVRFAGKVCIAENRLQVPAPIPDIEVGVNEVEI